MPQNSTAEKKTAPTVTNIGATNASDTEFRDNLHRGHRLTRVGSFQQDGAAKTTEVWYCQNDHALVVS